MADANITQGSTQLQNPQQSGPKPPYPAQKLPVPGQESEMQLKPDHGEQSYRGSGKLTGRTALITGADSGIGKAVALAFAREGADVLISYLNEEEDAKEAVRLVEEAGRRAIRVGGDIKDEAHCQLLVQRAIDEFGHLDILVNNAAHQKVFQDITEISTEEWYETFRTNVDAMFFLCRSAIPHMKAGSSIINTASIQAYQPSPSLLPYATTKGAIVNFSQGLAQMVGQKGIRVNVVAPGPVWTPLIPSTMPTEQVKQFGQQTPLGRAAQPAELAPVYVLLASPEASYISGEVYGVTGGEPLF
jgi:NAD(P)-dependent dehydrogenase (short-subunit alcohol dehydrogenase family)